MNNDRVPRSELRTYTVSRSGHFDAAHFLPDYPGKCANVHGHRWEVTATIDFPIVPVAMVSYDDPDACGMLVDFSDIKELWAEYDHPADGLLNNLIPNPTAEVIANILLEALCDLVEESLEGYNLPFNATISLWEGPDAHVEVSVYQSPFIADDQDDNIPWTAWLRGDLGYPKDEEECSCSDCCQEKEATRQAAHRRIADTVTSL